MLKMKILIIQPKIGMGDMVIYLPYIHAISKKYNIPVSVLVKKNSRAEDLLVDDNHVNEIITLKRDKKNKGKHDGVAGFFNLIKELKSKEFDNIFIFSSSFRYFLVAKLLRIKNIFQYPLFRKNDNVVLSAKIFIEKNFGIAISTQPILQIKKEKVLNIKSKFKDKFKHVCLGFSASGPTKRWDLNNYIKLCIKINNHVPTKFYLAGGINDKHLIDQILKSEIGNNCESFIDLKIKETIPIIKNCNLYIGNDTGWLHISSALGINCLALFMDSPVVAYGKYSKNISVIVPDGETEESTTHNTLGKEKISFDKVFEKSIKLLI